jgi:hypothetical protein
MVKDNKGHGFHSEENQSEVYETMDCFLAYLKRASPG